MIVIRYPYLNIISPSTPGICFRHGYFSDNLFQLCNGVIIVCWKAKSWKK